MASLILVVTLVGFNAVSYLPGYLGVDSRFITVPFRALVLGLLIFALYRILAVRHIRMRLRFPTLLATFFLAAYSLRYIADAVILQVPLGTAPGDIALYLFGICIPAFLVFYLIRDLNFYSSSLFWITAILGLCCLISMKLTDVSQQAAQHGRFGGNEVLNPIGYGHMGVTAMIAGAFLLLQIGKTRYSWLTRLMAAGAIGCGAFSLLAAGSRGALVAAIILLPVVVFLALRRGSRLMTIGLCASLFFVFSASYVYLSQRGVSFDRMFDIAQGYTASNDSVYARENMVHDAWQEYLHSPWVGNSLIEPNSMSYPHNCIVEAFMSTGTFGGVAFALLIGLAGWRALKLIRRNPAMAWLPLFFFQFLIGAMLSGGLYANPLLWATMAIVFGVDMPARRVRSTNHRMPRDAVNHQQLQES